MIKLTQADIDRFWSFVDRKPTTIYNVIRGISWSWLTGRQRAVLEMVK